MNKIYGLFVILGVFGEIAFCQEFIPFPYEHQNIDLARTLFGSFFDKVNPIEARNDTPTTAAPITTTSKPAQSTTEDLLIIPIYEDVIYDPNDYRIPPYPVLYNAPVQDSRLLLDNFEPNYPLINGFSSTYPQTGIQSLPFFNPSLINGAQKNMILQPIDSNAIPGPINENSPIGIQSLGHFNPISSTVAKEKMILLPSDLKTIPKPTNVKPSILTSPLENGNINNVEMTDDDRNTLTKEIQKLLVDFIMKKQQKMEESFDNEQISYKTLAPLSSTFVPQVTTSSYIPVVEDVIEGNEQSNQTNKLDVDKIPLGNESISNSSSHYKQLEQTAQSSTEVNQFDNATHLQNETDDWRKLDFGVGEEDYDEDIDTRGEFSTIPTTDKSYTIYSKDMIKRLESNQTSVNSFKLNDRFFPEFINMNGKNCSAGMGKYQGEDRLMIICAEESFDGKTLRKTTHNKTNVTFYTEELPTTSTTTELTVQFIDEIMKNSSRSFGYEIIDTDPWYTDSHNTTTELTTPLKKDNVVFNGTSKTSSQPCKSKKIETARTTSTKTAEPTTENPITIFDKIMKTYSTSPPDSNESEFSESSSTSTYTKTTQLTTEDPMTIFDKIMKTYSTPRPVDSNESEFSGSFSTYDKKTFASLT